MKNYDTAKEHLDGVGEGILSIEVGDGGASAIDATILAASALLGIGYALLAVVSAIEAGQ